MLNLSLENNGHTFEFIVYQNGVIAQCGNEKIEDENLAKIEHLVHAHLQTRVTQSSEKVQTASCFVFGVAKKANILLLEWQKAFAAQPDYRVTAARRISIERERSPLNNFALVMIFEFLMAKERAQIRTLTKAASVPLPIRKLDLTNIAFEHLDKEFRYCTNISELSLPSYKSADELHHLCSVLRKARQRYSHIEKIHFAPSTSEHFHIYNLFTDAIANIPTVRTLEITTAINNSLNNLIVMPDLQQLKIICTSQDNATITQQGLLQLANLRHLQTLAISCLASQKNDFLPLASLTLLKDFELSSCDVTDHIFSVVASFPELETLCLSHTKVKGHGLSELASMTKLHNVDMRSSAVTHRTIGEIIHLTSLQTLNLSSNKLTDAAVPAIAMLASLRTLNLENSRLTDNGIAHLRVLKHLTALNLAENDIAGVGLSGYLSLGLKALNLSKTRTSDVGMQSIAPFAVLEILNLRYCPITEAGLKHISHLESLVDLDLAGSQVANIKPLASVHSLQCLDLSGTAVSKIKTIASLGNLRALNISNTSVKNAKALSLLRNLTFLRLSVLDLKDKNLPDFGALQKLHLLSIDRNRVTDSGLKQLANLQQLRHLNLKDTEVTAVCLDVIATLQLESLNVENCAIAKEDLEKLLFSRVSSLKRSKCLYS